MSTRSIFFAYTQLLLLIISFASHETHAFQAAHTHTLAVMPKAVAVQPTKGTLSSSPFHSQSATINRPRYSSLSSPSSLSLSPLDSASLLVSSDNPSLQSFAEALGYLLGAASLLLYTPIAVRILRKRSAEGLAVSTWWLKLTSYTCTDVYNIKNSFPIAAFSETIVITFEAVAILGLVTYFQKRIDRSTLLLAFSYFILTSWALGSPSNVFPWGPPDEWIGLALISSTVLNTGALLPQLRQNWERQSSGGYSPVTASLAAAGCAIRLFTTMELANGDPLLLFSYGSAMLLNLSVLFQILYFGTQIEKKSLVTLFLADVQSTDDTDEMMEGAKLEVEMAPMLNANSAIEASKTVEDVEQMATLSKR